MIRVAGTQGITTDVTTTNVSATVATATMAVVAALTTATATSNVSNTTTATAKHKTNALRVANETYHEPQRQRILHTRIRGIRLEGCGIILRRVCDHNTRDTLIGGYEEEEGEHVDTTKNSEHIHTRSQL